MASSKRESEVSLKSQCLNFANSQMVHSTGGRGIYKIGEAKRMGFIIEVYRFVSLYVCLTKDGMGAFPMADFLLVRREAPPYREVE